MREQDALFTTRRVLIPVPSLSTEIYLVPFGDVHRHAPNCNVEKWKYSLQQMKELGPNTYFIGMGDYDEVASSSERRVINEDVLHDSTFKRLEKSVDADTDELAEELGFMKGRLLGLLSGNHYFRYSSGISNDQKLCAALDAPYLGASAVIRLALRCSHGLNAAVDVWAHHGAFGGRSPGGSINRVEQMRDVIRADIYLQGHDHRRSAVPMTIMCPDMARNGFTVRHKTQWLVRTGSFLNAYEPGKASYIVPRMGAALDQGFVILRMRMKRTAEGKSSHLWVDTHAML